MSIGTKLQNKEQVTGGAQAGQVQVPWLPEIHISKKCGFAKFNVDEFEKSGQKSSLCQMESCRVKYIQLCPAFKKPWCRPLLTLTHQ